MTTRDEAFSLAYRRRDVAAEGTVGDHAYIVGILRMWEDILLLCCHSCFVPIVVVSVGLGR